MPQEFTHSFTPEKLQKLERDKLENVLANARKHNAEDLVAMCLAEIETRPLRKARNKHSQSDRSDHDVVTGYHFVCTDDRGVTQSGENEFWSGSWVVAIETIERSLKYGAYLALHESKSELSYRQGQILDFRTAPRSMVSKSEEGVEFLVRADEKPREWIGAGAGEKGYLREKTSKLRSTEKEASKK